MSFSFNWPRFSDQFHHDAIQMLNNALNKGNKPPVIADKIEVVELEMGTQPPELEIRDIGDLAVDHFRGIFRLTYAGDAHIVLKTKVQANPLNHKQPDIHFMTGSQGMLAAKQALVVPMLLRLSHFRLSSYVVLVVSKQKGITLVFKTDPLQNVDINSTFDSIAVIQKFIQREIEGQLRQMFREDLPGIIHRLSQQWVKSKVEAPYLTKRPPVSHRPVLDTSSMPDLIRPHTTSGMSSASIRPQRPESLSAEYRRPRSASGLSIRSLSRAAATARTDPIATTSQLPKPASPAVEAEHGSFSEIENFDPTYGLRPEGLPTKSGFHNFSSLFVPNKGLADLAEEPSEQDYDDDEATSFDMVDWDDAIPDLSPPSSVHSDRHSVTEYETLPAVGGGTITRPRIIHAQSMIHQSSSSSPVTPSIPLPSSSQSQQRLSGSGYTTPSPLSRHSHSSYFTDLHVPHSAPLFSTSGADSDGSSSSVNRGAGRDNFSRTHGKSHSVATELTASEATMSSHQDIGPTTINRRFSVSSTSTLASQVGFSFSPGTSPPNEFNGVTSISPGNNNAPNPSIVLRPSLMTNSIHQLSTLSHSNHTLSPYTRSLAHFTVRSVPPRGLSASVSAERQPVKAKRKRTFRLGGAKQQQQQQQQPPPVVDVNVVDDTVTVQLENETSLRAHSSSPPSDFDAADMDLYFRFRDDNRSPSHTSRAQSAQRLRRRQPPPLPPPHPSIQHRPIT